MTADCSGRPTMAALLCRDISAPNSVHAPRAGRPATVLSGRCSFGRMACVAAGLSGPWAFFASHSESMMVISIGQLCFGEHGPSALVDEPQQARFLSGMRLAASTVVRPARRGGRGSRASHKPATGRWHSRAATLGLQALAF